MFGKTRTIHFIGIGGSGMCGIAEILMTHGMAVSGSDLADGENTSRLRSLGAAVAIGHRAENLGSADVVVVSSAVPESNPEIVEARRRKIPVIARAEMLAELMKLKYSIAVGGTHGKTTTTALVGTVLEHAGLDPTVIDGGRLVHLDSGARAGKSELMVVEADEAYGSIKRFDPTIAVVTSVDADHLDYYRNIDEIRQVFLDFVNRVPFYGMSVLCLDQENIQALIPQVQRRFMTYGIATNADVTASDLMFNGVNTQFIARYRDNVLGKVRTHLPGEHNVLNSLAAISVGLEMGVPFTTMADALGAFQGVRRRFEVVGEAQGVLIVDDYAHNPAKLRAAFAAARAGYPERRLVVVFQPHRYHRVHHLSAEFARSFYQADVVYVTEIYGAGEEPIEGVSGEGLVAAIREHGHRCVISASSRPQLIEDLKREVAPGDTVMTVGAGDVWKVGAEFLQWLNAEETALE
ncbi:UDP-N-acetylmuramate--L-alanine ligase [Candidatus Poribacteria bacterium]|nr:UDP-N-acetylmuramate--L-alanine ligase [Candidatus Poribacteria bacterium]